MAEALPTNVRTTASDAVYDVYGRAEFVRDLRLGFAEIQTPKNFAERVVAQASVFRLARIKKTELDRMHRVLARRENFQVLDRVVELVPVSMIDLEAGWNRSAESEPDEPVEKDSKSADLNAVIPTVSFSSRSDDEFQSRSRPARSLSGSSRFYDPIFENSKSVGIDHRSDSLVLIHGQRSYHTRVRDDR